MSPFRPRLNRCLTTVLVASLIFSSLGIPARAKAAALPSGEPAENAAATDSLRLSISEKTAQNPTADPKADDFVEPISQYQSRARVSMPALASPAYVPARAGLQSTAVPTYYLDNTAHTVYIEKLDTNEWAARGCFYDWAEGDVQAVVFRTEVQVNGGICILKPMGKSEAQCIDGTQLWRDTSYSLGDDGYYCTSSSQSVCSVVAPDATFYNDGWESGDAGESVCGGFHLYHITCRGEARIYDIRLVYYGIPPNPADQSLSPDECPVCHNGETYNFPGGPINTLSGNYNYQVTDISIPTLGEPLRFERTYNSLPVTGSVVYSRPLGYGWTHNYDIDLTFPGDPGGEENTIILKAPHGSRMRFKDYGSGDYEPFPGIWADLSREEIAPDTYVYTVTTGNQNTFVFDDDGQITTRIDPKGNQTTFSYTDVLTRVTGPGGQRWLDFDYDGQGRLIAVTDHTGRGVGYGYENENLVAVTDTLDHVWTYTYVEDHLLHEVIEPAPQYRVVERTFYDGQGRATRQENGMDEPVVEIEYLSTDGQRVVTENGKTVTDTYDAWNVLVGQVDSEGNAQTYTFDEHFNRATSTDAKGTTQFERDRYGYAERVIDAKGYSTTIDYDDYHNVTVITNAMGYTTTFEYDGMDLKAVTDTMQHVTRFSYNGYGQVTGATVSETVTTDYEYDDPLGQLIAVTDAMNNVTTFEYDPVGRLVTTTLAVGTAQEYRTVNTYDEGDNLLKVVVNHVDGVYNPNAPDEDLVTEYEYDAAGRLERITDPLDRVTVYEYDGAGRLLKTTENLLIPYGPYYQQQYNLVTEYRYDDAGNPAWITDTLGNVTYYEYDELNRPIRVTENVSTTERADTNITTRFEYDAVGNVEWITDTLGRASHNEYDELGRLIAVTLNYTTAGGPYYLQQYNVATTYTYNPLGWQTSVTDGRNDTTTYEHDRLGQVTKIVDAEGGETDFAYNPLGLRTRIEDGADVTTWLDYDPLGRLERVWDELGNTTQYTYDALGNRTTMNDAEGVVTRYEYDTVGRLTAVIENYRQRFPSNHEQNVRTEYTYDGAGNLEKVTDARGYATTYAYDLLDRVTEITDPLSQITSYGYGRPLGSPTYRHEPGNVDTVYTYDDMGRTTYAQYQDRGVVYTYDKLGNLLSMAGTDGHHRTITLDALDRPLNVEEDLSTFEDTFDTLDGSEWVFNAYQSIENGTLKNTGTDSDYTANFRRNAYTISEGEGIRIEFRVDRGHTIAHFALENSDGGTYRRWAMIASGDKLWVQTNDGGGYQWVADLINPVQTGTWYVLVLKADEDGWFSAEVWQKDDPSVRGTYSGQLTGGLNWRFHHWIKFGTAWMDNYREFTYHAATTHTYDQVGNRTALTYADQAVTFAYDGVNRLASVTGWGSQVTYGYDGAGRVLTTTLPNGVVTTRIHDDAGRLTDIVHAGPSWGLAHYHYVLDGLGNRLQAVERVLPPTPVTHLPLAMRNYGDGGEMMSMPEGGLAAPETFQSPLQPVEPVPAPTPTPEANSRTPGKARLTGTVSGFAPLRWLGDALRWLAEGLGKIWRAIFPPGGTAQNAPLTFTSPIGGQGFGEEVTINYVYDKLYRLTDADYTTGQSFDYAYDAAGNRTSYSGPEGTHSYTYDQANRLTQVDGTTYTYDGRGNLTWDGTRSYTWDGAGRLESVTQGGTTTAYTYAGDGVRLVKEVQGQAKTRYVQDLVSPLPNVLAETTGSATTHYLYGLSQLAQIQDDQTQWLLGDGLGSVRQIVNGQGHIVLTRSYSPFGKLLGEDEDVATGFGFAGEQTDPNGLIFLRARYYDVQTGRFVSKDPFPGVSALPQSLHAYTYCFNNPINLIDPSGEFVITGSMLAAAAIATAFGAAIGAVVGGVGYALTHRCEDIWHSKDFWQAVGIGALSGAASGLVASVIPMLLPAAASVWGAVGIGSLTGALSAGAGKLASNVLTPSVQWNHNLLQTMLFGGITGGVLGGVGYKLKPWLTTLRLQSLANKATQSVDDLGPGAYSPKQRLAMRTHPRLRPAFRGWVIDREFKDLISKDPLLSHLQTARLFQKMPDVVDPTTGTWWDLTTVKQWPAHLLRYVPLFGPRGNLIRHQ